MTVSEKDRKTLAAALRHIYAAADLHEFRATAVATVAQLVNSEVTSYNEVNAARHTFFTLTEPQELLFPCCEELFLQHMHDNPLVTYSLEKRDGQARKISDFISQEKFHDRGIYCELYQRLGAEYQMAVCLPSRSAQSTLVAFAVNRKIKDFSERERSMLNVMRPHLAQAFENAGLATHLKQAIDVGDVGAIVLTAQGRVLMMTAAAERSVADFFGRRALPSRRLPEPLWRCVKHEIALREGDGGLLRPAGSWEVEHRGQTWLLRLIANQVPDQYLLILKRKPAQLSAQSLQSLGLGAREAEVLYWVMQGKTNPEIGAILNLTAGTVKKNLDRVYDKLGAYNRVAATMQALQSLELIASK